MLKLFPEMVDCNEGTLRCRNKVTPMYLACISKLPIEIIQFVYEKHKEMNAPNFILFNGEEIDIKNDILYINSTPKACRNVNIIFKN